MRPAKLRRLTVARWVLVTMVAISSSAISSSAISSSATSFPTTSSAATVAQETPLIVPGGEAFVRSVLGMPTGPDAGTDLPGGFLTAVAQRVTDVTTLDLAARLGGALDDLEALRLELLELDRRYGPERPRLGEPGTPTHDKAVALLGWFGLTVQGEGEQHRIQREVGDREARRRRLLDWMGIGLAYSSRLWTAGEPIGLEVVETPAPLLLGAGPWRALLPDRAGEFGLFRAIVESPVARDLLLGYAHLDRPTREALFDRLGLETLHGDSRLAEGFRRLAPYLRVDPDAGTGGALLLPGGDRDAWEAILGTWQDSAGLLRALAGSPRAAHLWRALSLVPAERARYLLTLGRADAAGRADWARRLHDRLRTPAGAPGLAPPIRWPDDAAELFLSLRLRADGRGIAWPGGARAWLAALDDDDPPRTAQELDRLLDAFESAPDSGPEADARLLPALLRGARPGEELPGAIERFRVVSEALRYQPLPGVERAIPLLFREQHRFGRAWGFLVVPTPLEAGTIEAMVFRLQELAAVEELEPRREGTRQLQATLMLTRRILLNGLVPADRLDPLLRSLFALPLDPELGLGPALLGWWRDELLPVASTALVENGWDGDPGDPRAVVVAGLVGGIAPTRLDVDGIPYRATPSRTLGRRFQLHLARQQIPRLDRLFELDRLATAVETGAPGGPAPEARPGEAAAEASPAGRIAELLQGLREGLPANVVDGGLDESLPVPVPRTELFAAGDALVRALGGPGGASGHSAGASGNPAGASGDASSHGESGQGEGTRAEGSRDAAPTGQPATLAARVRRALPSYLGDALVGALYSLHLGDPESLVFEHAHLAWLHHMGPPEPPDGVSTWRFGPWGPTTEGWAGNEGARLQFSLFGVPAALGRWHLDASLPGGSGTDPVAQEAWGMTLGQLHLPSLHASVQGMVARRARQGGRWIDAAAEARDRDLPAPVAEGAPPVADPADEPAGPAETPGLAGVLSSLLEPWKLQRLRDAVAAGDREAALDEISPGNRYLLGRVADGGDLRLPVDLRWSLDQTVGMAVGRRGEYLGLAHPPAVPYGEVGDPLADPGLYSRLLDVRVSLAAAQDALELPPSFQARLLPRAMGAALARIPSTSSRAWADLLGAIPEIVTPDGVGRWLVDLAFAEEFLEPADPLVAGADTGPATDDAPAARESRGGELTLPAAPDAPQATFGARVDLVQVDLGVWTGDGDFVTDLALEEIEIRWRGRTLEPEFLRLEGSPRSTIFVDELPEEVAERVEPRSRNLVLVADLLTTTPADWERVLADTLEFVRAGVSPEDRLALVAIDTRGRPEVLENFTFDHPRIEDALEGLGGNVFGGRELEDAVAELSRTLCDNSLCTDIENPENCHDLQPTRAFPACLTLSEDWELQKFQMAQSQINLWAADQERRARQVVQAVETVGTMLDLGDPLERSKSMVLLSSGFEMTPGSLLYDAMVEYASENEYINPSEVPLPRDDMSQEMEGLAGLMHRCRCTVYSLGTLGLGTFQDGPGGRSYRPVVEGSTIRRTLQDPLNAIARDTGGRPFFGSDIGQGFRQVLQDTRLRWVVGLSVSDQSGLPEGLETGGEPTWQEIQVRVTRPDVEVRARPGFFWPPRR